MKRTDCLKAPVLLAVILSTPGCLGVALHHVAPAIPPPPTYAPLAIVRIEPTSEWTDTPVTVQTGDLLIVHAVGAVQWRTVNATTNPDGRGWSSFGVGEGGLIGRIDGGKAFDIGARTHLFPDMHARPPHIPFVPPPLRVKRDGKLFLGFKDWKPGKFDGAFTVTIWRKQPGADG